MSRRLLVGGGRDHWGAPALLRRREKRKTWLTAWGLTLGLHGLLALGVQGSRLATPTPPKPRELEPVQLVFVEPPPRAPAKQSPTFFSELPPDRTDEAPEKADFLSNVTSRARDRMPGGSDALPRMQGESDAPTVALDPSEAGSPSPPPPRPSPAKGSPEKQRPGESAQPLAGQAPERSTVLAPPTAVRSDSGGPHGETVPGAVTRTGGSDIHQPEMDRPEGNAGLTGDVSLNTTAWDYAPWLQRFGRRLMRRWIAPPAYYIGILKDGGWAVVEVEISRSGQLLRMEVLEEQGHPALIQAAASGVRSTAPLESLPADFPEETLILRIRMVYPKFRPR